MNNIAMCGLDCGICEYREEFNCKGCDAQQGLLIWGECKVAKCCIEKDLKHCGNCNDFACKTLNEFSYDKEHGDNGRRIENLKSLNEKK